MPYASNADLPDYIRKLSPRLQDVWRGAFNAAFKRYGTESQAFAVANSVLKKMKGDG
jgi:cation transport regulator ChaB